MDKSINLEKTCQKNENLPIIIKGANLNQGDNLINIQNNPNNRIFSSNTSSSQSGYDSSNSVAYEISISSFDRWENLYNSIINDNELKNELEMIKKWKASKNSV